MKIAITASLLLLGAATAFGQSIDASAPAADAPEVLEVAMIERGPTTMRFEPGDLVVRPGDVLRFVQRGDQPHNVEFTRWPEGAELGEIRLGPFLMGKGEVYEVVVDERFVPGEYEIVCTPHVPMGMVATVTVVGAAADRKD